MEGGAIPVYALKFVRSGVGLVVLWRPACIRESISCSKIPMTRSIEEPGCSEESARVVRAVSEQRNRHCHTSK